MTRVFYFKSGKAGEGEVKFQNIRMIQIEKDKLSNDYYNKIVVQNYDQFDYLQFMTSEF